MSSSQARECAASTQKRKVFTHRIRGIPRNLSFDSLKAQLERALDVERQRSSQPLSDNSLRLTLAESSARSLVATFTSTQTLSGFPYPIDHDFIGVTPLYDPPKGTGLLDIIAVPGLGSHAIGGYKAVNGNNVWIRDYLPLDIPSARVLVYGYDTAVTATTEKRSITDLAESFLDSIIAFRSATDTHLRPMILIGHSLGGIVIKKALSLALEYSNEQRNNSFFKSVHSLIFFGVPNLGINMVKLQEITKGQFIGQIIRDIHISDENEPTPFLRSLSEEFINCCKKQTPEFQITSYFESKATPTVEINPEDGTLRRSGRSVIMVTQESARRIGFSDHRPQQLPADHSSLVKFSSDSDNSYVRVIERIKFLAEDAPGVVKQRFSNA